jgi:hypothetical protein
MTTTMPASNKMIWTGRVISAVVTLFMLMDAAMKVMKARPAVVGTVQAGFPESTVFGIGMALLISTILYAIPRTSVLGAILLTAYLGGAVATNVRLSTPLFSYVLAPVYVAVLAWGGLFLRDERVRELIPLRR